jgi:tRNA pseudouridine38-40 synthase
VHASQYFAHFVANRKIDFDIVYKLNRMLPDDIAVYNCTPVSEKANAQLDAVSRTYEYFIHLEKDPFLHNKSACYDLLDLNFELMQKAVALFPKYQDFRFFCLQPDAHNHTRCDLRSVEMDIFEDGDSNRHRRIKLTFTSDRFLRGMIRIIVARLLEVGQGKVSLEELESSLRLEQANRWMNSAYAEGLYLAEVVYKPGIIPDSSLEKHSL